MKENKALIIVGVAVVVFTLFYGLIIAPQNAAELEVQAEIERVQDIEDDYDICIGDAYVTYSDWWDLRCNDLYLGDDCVLPSINYYGDIQAQYESDKDECLEVLKARN